MLVQFSRKIIGYLTLRQDLVDERKRSKTRITLPVHRIALLISRIALPVRRIALPVCRIALPVNRIALPVRHIALPVCRIVLPARGQVRDGRRVAEKIVSKI